MTMAGQWQEEDMATGTARVTVMVTVRPRLPAQQAATLRPWRSMALNEAE